MNGMNLTGGKIAVAYVVEEEWGVTPANPDMNLIRGLKSESLGASREDIPSGELNPWRADSYTSKGPQNVSGGLDLELNESALELIATAFGKVESTQEDPLVELYKHKVTVTEPNSVTIQKTLDNSVFHIFRGEVINSITVTHESKSYVGCAIDFMGKSYEKTRIALDSSIDFPKFKPFDTIRHSIFLNDEKLSVNSLTYTITNNAEMTNSLGEDGMSNMGFGKFEVTGSFSINIKKNDTIFQDKLDNEVEDELRIQYSDKLKVVIPKVKYNGDLVPKGAGSGLVNIEVNFRGLIDLDTKESIYFELISDKPTL